MMSENREAWLAADCHKCADALRPSMDAGGFGYARMIVCVTCGNKRCPKATDHSLACSGSNEPGQAGSVYA